MSQQGLFRVGEAARKLNLSPSRVRRLILNQKLECVLVRKEKRIPQSEITRLKIHEGAIIALYACVPQARQGDLELHVKELQYWVQKERPGLRFELFSDIGVSSNPDRRSFKALMNEARRHKIHEIVVCYEDCFYLGDSVFLNTLLDDLGVVVEVLHPNQQYFLVSDLVTAMDRFFISRLAITPEKRKTLRSELRKLLQNE